MTEIGDESSIAPEFKPWRTGQPYNFPLPKSDSGDPWKVLLEQRKRDDYGRCEVWKDEVQNLLIFAGLFSAVVTAFVVESYTTLQEDPSEKTVLLLNQIFAQLRDPSSSNATLSEFDFSPKSSDLRVNIFWFLSLIFSLVTVLVGILSLQWLREYQRPRNIESRRAFALHHMHTESLDAWYMPEIFTSLPLLLQLALVLFFIGLCDFAWNLHHSLAIPIVITIILTLTFFIVTTVLPTLHVITLFFRRRDEKNRKPRIPCPYNSPQAQVFHRLHFLLLSLCRKLYCRLYYRLPRFRRKRYELPELIFRIQQAAKKIQPWYLLRLFNVHDRGSGGWTDLGITWLCQRDADYINATPAGPLGRPDLERGMHIESSQLQTLYDTAKALVIARDTVNPSTDQVELAALHSCASQLVDPTSGSLAYKFDRGHWINYSYYAELLVTPPNEGTALFIDRTTLPLLDELNFLSFFCRNFSLTVGDKALRENIIERSVRLAEWVYGQGEMRAMIPVNKMFMSDHRFDTFSSPLYAASSLVKDSEEPNGLGDQVVVIIRKFFETILKYQLPDDPPCLSHTSIHAYHFLREAAEILHKTTSVRAVAYNERTLNMIVDWLRQSRHKETNTNTTEGNPEPFHPLPHSSTSLKQQYVFTMAIMYARCLRNASSADSNTIFKITTSKGFARLRDVLQKLYDELHRQPVNAIDGDRVVESAEARTNAGDIQMIDGENPGQTGKEKAWKEYLKEMLKSVGIWHEFKIGNEILSLPDLGLDWHRPFDAEPLQADDPSTEDEHMGACVADNIERNTVGN